MSDIPLPPTLGLVLAGGLARRMGGGDKARIAIGGVTILDRVLARLSAAMRRHHPQRQRRSRRASPTPAAGGRRQRAGLSPARSPASWPGSTGRPRSDNGVEWLRQRAGRLPVPAARSGRAAAYRRAKMGAGVPLACARSGEWRHPVVGLWPVALRADLRQAAGRGGPAQDRGVDRAARRRAGRLAGRAGRSVLQRQHAGGCRARPSALRCNITASDALDPARAARIFAIITLGRTGEEPVS